MLASDNQTLSEVRTLMRLTPRAPDADRGGTDHCLPVEWAKLRPVTVTKMAVPAPQTAWRRAPGRLLIQHLIHGYPNQSPMGTSVTAIPRCPQSCWWNVTTDHRVAFEF